MSYSHITMRNIFPMKTLALGLTALALLALLGTIGEANLTEGLILYVPFLST